MLWVFWDIFLPIALAFAAGLFFGWLMWRWRREKIDAEKLRALRRYESQKTGGDYGVDDSQQNHRSRLHSGDGIEVIRESDREPDRALLKARKRIEILSAELKISREEVINMRRGMTKLKDTRMPTADTGRLQVLEARLHSANQKIADLQSANEKSAANRPPQAPARYHPPASKAETLALQEEVATRDSLIETLRQSLAQYGAENDNTVLAAEVALRDRKIDALENLLFQARTSHAGQESVR